MRFTAPWNESDAGSDFATAYHWTFVKNPPVGTASGLGSAVFKTWGLPFEVVSVLLLAALVGAIVVSRPVGAGDA